MIHKDSDHVVATNKYEQAGQAAERQMAFYLRRAFADSPEIHVINDLRLTRNGETSQIDHLIVHKCGFIIIESKSSHGIIHVNASREFSRMFGRKQTGMASPIEQARRQGELLRALLQDHREALRAKVLAGMMQGGFKGCYIQALVAISDTGRIEGDRSVVPELLKADLVAEKAREYVERHRRASSLVPNFIDAIRGRNLDKGWGEWWFGEEDVRKTISFLLAHNQSLSHQSAPVAPAAPTPTGVHPPVASGPASQPPRPTHAAPAPTAAPKPTPTYLCTKCQSTHLDLLFARSYYFKCRDCSSNTPIRNVCRTCSQITRTSKRKRQYFSICDSCKTELLFFSQR